MRKLTAASIVVLCSFAAVIGARPATAADPVRPNIVIIFTDDQGYGDVGVYGASGYTTPHLDRMAAEGVRFTDFYAAQAVCSSSRAALLTGCYPNRIGVVGALGPTAGHGIHDDETTLAELCKQNGYATAALGKWHLGHHPQFLPTRHGFDEYFGLPYSNDMWPYAPHAQFPDLPLIENEAIINPKVMPDDQKNLTTWYTQRAVSFIERSKDRPFFLYLAHSMPHVPLFVSEKFDGKTQGGAYGDVIAEIDWSVGQVLEAIQKNGLDEKTLVIFTTDNGPWLLYGDHGGSSGPLREGKGTAFEGGVRVPFIARWPGKIPAGALCHEPAMNIDLLPTVARLIGTGKADSPQRTETVPIDGKDIWPLLAGDPGARSPHEALYFYWIDQLHAVRSGRWKLHLPHTYPTITEPGRGGSRGESRAEKTDLSLYDLEADIGETKNLAAEHPQVVEALMRHVERARADLGDSLIRRKGAGTRPPGRVDPEE